MTTGQVLLSNPGLNFTGTPGLSVDRIRREQALAQYIVGGLKQPNQQWTALERLDDVRRQLRADPQWAWALEPQPLTEGGTTEGIPDSLAQALPIAAKLAWPFVRDFLWPLAIPTVIAFAIGWWMGGFPYHGVLPALKYASATLAITVVVAIVATAWLYRQFRSREDAEVPLDVAPNATAVAAIMQRENHAAQNHLGALSVMKPGLLRRFTLRLALWVVAQLAAQFFRPGFLGTLGTINFARWVTVPGTRDLLFMSNYGGSWESYLEDFITEAHGGLTGVWSNTVGFPRTTNLFQDGATDGDRFKRWARRQQIPTAFWYSAYPTLTTSNIRTSALIRQGLGAAMTEDEARSWLTLFGSEVRPVAALEANEIQSVVFGGLGFMYEGLALLFGLRDDRAAAKAWLAELLPYIRFSDGRTWPDATVLGLAASALPKLGLPADCIATFPATFVDGMAAPWRARVLGDVGSNAPEAWDWGGKSEDGIDGVLLLFARTRAEVDRLQERAEANLRSHGHAVGRIVRFQKLPSPDEAQPGQQVMKREPFGFADGISQPIIRGTYKALRGADPIHLVEAGEFIFGYPDNRGFIPPSPTLAALHDPTNLLPVAASPVSDFNANMVNADRDIGRNGTFLAIRQLEQHVDRFWDYCRSEGQRLKNSFPPGVRTPPEEFVAAKIVGRWPDGSPLVRYPRYPATHAPVAAHPLSRAGAGVAQSDAIAAVQIPAAPAPVRRAEKHLVLREDAPKADLTAAGALAHDKSAAPKYRPAFEADNDFLLGTEDPQGVRCPFGAHIRRANPRESFDPGSDEQIGITNRHRIIRIGRFYEPEPGQERGLFFMCLNGDIARQFEFVQQTWLQSPNFLDLSGERDPLLGGRDEPGTYTIPETAGPMRLSALPSFVRTRGGGYFFLPGRRTIEYLASQDYERPVYSSQADTLEALLKTAAGRK